MIDKKKLAEAIAYEYGTDEELTMAEIEAQPEEIGLMYTTYDDEEGNERILEVFIDLINMTTSVYSDGKLAYTEPFTEDDYRDITGEFGPNWYDEWYSYFLNILSSR